MSDVCGVTRGSGVHDMSACFENTASVAAFGIMNVMVVVVYVIIL